MDRVKALDKIKYESVRAVDPLRTKFCIFSGYSKSIVAYVQWIQQELNCVCAVDTVRTLLGMYSHCIMTMYSHCMFMYDYSD